MTNKLYALAGLAAPLLFWLTYFILAARRPAFSFLYKAISELGSVDAPDLWVWNVFGYIIPGCLIAIFSVGLYRNIVPVGHARSALVGLVASGLLMALAGIFPGDFNDRQSVTMLLHTLGSFGSYLGFLVGAFAFHTQMKLNKNWASAALPTLLFTWMTIVFGAWPFVFPDFPAAGQRLVFGFYFLWITYTAFRLYHTRS